MVKGKGRKLEERLIYKAVVGHTSDCNSLPCGKTPKKGETQYALADITRLTSQRIP